MATLPTVLVKTIPCKQSAVRAVRFNVDGNYCLTCGSDKTVKLWNPYRGIPLKTYQGHGYESSGRINAVAFNEESTIAMSASLDGTVRCYDIRVRGGDPVQVLDEATDSVTCLCVTDHEIVTGSADCNTRNYDLKNGQMHMDFVANSVTSVNFTKDGQCLLISTMDSTIRLLDKTNGELLVDFTGHKNNEYKIDSCLLSSDAQVISGSEDGHVYIWDLVEAKILAKLVHSGHQVVHSVSAHPTKQYLITAAGQNIFLWSSTELQDLT